MGSLSKSFNLIDEIINFSDFKSDEIYSDVLLKICSVFSDFRNKSCAIFFVEDLNCTLKSAFNNGKKISRYAVNALYFDKLCKQKNNFLILKTQKDELLYDNTILYKLAIRNSVFGFILFSFESKITKEMTEQLNALSSTISYKIKDYELNEVFKLQLRAMQDAMADKDEAYEIIKKQHKKLIELDKTKTLFLANISHDLRTPLNAIIGFSQALSAEIFGQLNEKQSEYINDIQISSLHLLGMINEILDISKLEAHALKFSPAEMSPHQAIQEAVNVLEPLYKDKNIKVNFISEYDGKIIADYQKFQQILYNLLSNAIKFTDKEGKIEIKSSAKKKDYYLTIKDNGIGIDKKYHNKIFKKFVHLNNSQIKNQNSTGLGLTITKELVKLHNGKITLLSELNKGAAFNMEFKNIIV